MLHNIDTDMLTQVCEQSPEAKAIINTLLENHRQILSTVSHEIRNPLTLVYSKLQMMQSKHPEVHDFKFWDSTFEDVEFMKQLLEELSSYNNAATLHITPIKPTTFFQKLVLSFAISIEDTEIEFTSDIPDELPLVNGDQTKLQQVFLNIMRNAKEALSHKGIINFFVSIDQDNLIVSIQNNGPCIPPNQIDHIFEMFQTYKQGGTGLGLALSKRIIEAHHGNISVLSTDETGTCFIISLPIIFNAMDELLP